jgi:DNA-binding transcriptional LysR family regulator
MFTLDDLKLICDLVETGSFTKAAQRNFLTQSAVSQRLRAMETRLGKPLLERGRGRAGVVPTEAGRTLYEGGRDVLAAAQDLAARVQGPENDPAGPVRVVTVYSVGLHALPARLKPFVMRNPRVQVQLAYGRMDRVYREVYAREADVGIVACPLPSAGIEVLPFDNEEMALVCPPEHPLAKRTDVALRELDGLPFVAFPAGVPTRNLIEERLRAAGVVREPAMEFDNIETIKNVVEIGLGVSVLPAATALAEAERGTLAVVPLCEEDRFTRPTGVLVKQSAMRPPAVAAFLEALTASAA